MRGICSEEAGVEQRSIFFDITEFPLTKIQKATTEEIVVTTELNRVKANVIRPS